MLAGMVEPTAGEVLIDDHPLEFGDYSFRSQRIRMIFRIRRHPSTRASVFRRFWTSRFD
jgi:ABC-type antimicrobial peptide transport system ATPase subunit